MLGLQPFGSFNFIYLRVAAHAVREVACEQAPRYQDVTAAHGMCTNSMPPPRITAPLGSEKEKREREREGEGGRRGGGGGGKQERAWHLPAPCRWCRAVCNCTSRDRGIQGWCSQATYLAVGFASVLADLALVRHSRSYTRLPERGLATRYPCL